METPKRNDPCHCDSGKKYKKCCMMRDLNPPEKRDEQKPQIKEYSKKRTIIGVRIMGHLTWIEVPASHLDGWLRKDVIDLRPSSFNPGILAAAGMWGAMAMEAPLKTPKESWSRSAPPKRR